MNSKKAKKARRMAKQLTQHLPERKYLSGDKNKMTVLHGCTKGAYKAIKKGKVKGL